MVEQADGVLWPVLNVDRRVTFIGPEGVVEEVIRHEVRVYRHMDDVLRHLRAHSPSESGADTPGA